MEKVIYTEVPTSEKKEVPPPYVVPPSYPHHGGDDEEALLDDRSPDGCTPGRLFLASMMSALFCFWPAALIGMVYSIKARYSESPRARMYMRVAKRCLWISFIIGVVLMAIAAAVQMYMMGYMVKSGMKGAMRGYVAGAYDGENKGATDAKGLIQNGQAAKFPEQVPGQLNVFDINSPFWAKIMDSDDVKDAARVVGYSFGWVDGYKKGFCGTEKADCAGVQMKALTDYVQCDHMRQKMEKLKAKHMKKLEKGEREHKHKDKHEKKQEDEEHEEEEEEHNEEEVQETVQEDVQQHEEMVPEKNAQEQQQ